MRNEIEAERSAFSFKELAGRLGVSPWTLRRAAARGQLLTIRIGSRRLIPAAEKERILREGLIPQTCVRIPEQQPEQQEGNLSKQDSSGEQGK